MGKIHYAELDDMEKYNPKFVRELFKDLDEKEGHKIFRDWYSKNLPVDLLTWCRVNEPSDEMIYKQGYWRQIMLIRDTVNSLFYKDYDLFLKSPVMIIGTHTSKSIVLPVYEITLKEFGLKIVLRCNFHDWKLSIISERAIELDFMGLFKEDEIVHSVYCEGFSKDLVFTSYSEDKSMFTIEISDDFKLYTFMYILSNYFSNIIQRGVKNA